MRIEALAWIKSLQSWDTADYAIWILGGLAFFWGWLFHNMRRKAWSRVASGLGLQFTPAVLPETLSVKEATFSKVGDALRNCRRGTVAGRETVIFDQRTQMSPAYQPSGNAVAEQTVAGFRVSADTHCRDRAVIQASVWHVEKIGEWIFVFQQNRLELIS